VNRIRTELLFRPDPAHKLYDIYHSCVYSEKLLMMDRGNCPKHVEFYPKNKFDKLVHPVARCQQTCMTYTIAVCIVKNF